MKPTEFIIEYDENDPINIGRPKHFNPDNYCDIIEQMLAADEVLNALKMFDLAPSYYRANPTPRMLELKKQIYQHTWNITNYVEDDSECYDKSLEYQKSVNPSFDWPDLGTMIDIPFCYPRGPLILESVIKLNEQGITPFIWEMGPANFWLPHGLIKKGCKFNYYAQTLNKKALEDHKSRLQSVWKDRPEEQQYQIFICFETLEHLQNEYDILHQYHLYGANADEIYISTPMNTLLGGVADWKRELGHLRTFSGQDLYNICERLWPNYNWKWTPHFMQVMKGIKNGR